MNASKYLLPISLGALALSGWFYFSAGQTMGGSTLTEQQTAAIEKVIYEYLVNEPEVLIEASQALQQKAQEKAQVVALKGVEDNRDELLAANSLELGNPKGKIVIVKFLDYQCGHCKQMEPVIEQLVKENPEIHVVIKELPIFGGESKTAAKAAIASVKQGKFKEMHQALLTDAGKYKEGRVLEIAKEKGLDVAKLKKDMESPEIETYLTQVHELASKMSIQGTPFFVVMNDPKTGDNTAVVLPGGLPKPQFEKVINELKAKW